MKLDPALTSHCQRRSIVHYSIILDNLSREQAYLACVPLQKVSIRSYPGHRINVHKVMVFIFCGKFSHIYATRGLRRNI